MTSKDVYDFTSCKLGNLGDRMHPFLYIVAIWHKFYDTM
jgi:hypothetical protein